MTIFLLFDFFCVLTVNWDNAFFCVVHRMISVVLQMDCCGFSDDDEGYKAWNNNIYYNCTDENKSAEKCAVPWSCCVLKDVRGLHLI